MARDETKVTDLPTAIARLVCEHCRRPVEPAMMHADPSAMKCYGTRKRPGCGTVGGIPEDPIAGAIARLRALREAATPGSWFVSPPDEHGLFGLSIATNDPAADPVERCVVQAMEDPAEKGDVMEESDAALAVAAVNALLALLAVAEAAERFRRADTGGGFNDRVECGKALDAALSALAKAVG